MPISNDNIDSSISRGAHYQPQKMTLYHMWLHPLCRKVRLILAENHHEFQLRNSNMWQRDIELLKLNPEGLVPVLLIEEHEQQYAISGAQVICEYIDEKSTTPSLLGEEPAYRAEVRRLCAWFDHKFYDEVIDKFLEEKIMKRFLGLGAPNTNSLREGTRNLHIHLDYLSWILQQRYCLAGEMTSLADLTAAAHLSVIDYLGDMPWQNYDLVKQWYMRIKSRPSFHFLLRDYIPGAPPPDHYTDLDF